MTDKEFWDTFITERMQMHYSSGYLLTEDEIAAALQVEADYNHALETLPPKLVGAVKDFHENIVDKLTKETVFYYQKGLKDGLILYRTCTLEIIRNLISQFAMIVLLTKENSQLGQSHTITIHWSLNFSKRMTIILPCLTIALERAIQNLMS